MSNLDTTSVTAEATRLEPLAEPIQRTRCLDSEHISYILVSADMTIYFHSLRTSFSSDLHEQQFILITSSWSTGLFHRLTVAIHDTSSLCVIGNFFSSKRHPISMRN